MAPAGEVKQAIEAQLATIQSDPSNITNRAELAMIYQANAMPQTAVATWNQILSVEPTAPQHWYMLAQAQYKLGNYEDAVSAMATARDASPERSPLWWQPAFWHIEMGQAAEAEALARQSITIDPNNPGGYVACALAIMEQDRPSEARVVLEQLLAKVQHPYIRYLIGQTYQRERQPALAEPWLAQGDPRKPSFPDLWQTELKEFERGIDASLSRIDDLLEQGRNTDASARIQEAMLKWPQDVNLMHRQSEIYRRKGDIRRWLVVLKQAEKIDPENAATHLNLSLAYNQKGDSSLAMTHAMRSIDINPTMTAAHLQLGRLYILSDNLPEAATTLDKAFELGVEDPNERLQYANVLMRARRPADAEREALLVTQVSPTNPLGWCVLAESRYAQFKRDEAFKTLSDGLAVLPRNQSILMMRQKFEAFEKSQQ